MSLTPLLRPHDGMWWLWSPSDPHWRARGDGVIYTIADTPQDIPSCAAKIAELTAMYGPPPADMCFGLSKMPPLGVPKEVQALE